MHLSRRRKIKRNCGIRLGGIYRPPSDKVRILGLHLDPRLNWTSYRTAIKTKLTTQTLALSRLTGKTWGLPLQDARKVYTMVILPAITYLSTAWYTPLSRRQTGLSRELQLVQNSCLRQVLGAFKDTPVHSLHTLAHVPPLDLILMERSIAASARLRRHRPLIQSACDRISRTFKQTVSFSHITSPKPLPENWPLDWELVTRNEDVWNYERKELRKAMELHWRRRWERDKKSRSAEIIWKPDGKFLAINRGLHKAQSSIATQICTGKIGLNGYLHFKKVPGYDSPCCEECNVWESPRHVTVFCRKYRESRQELKTDMHLDFQTLMTTAKGIKKVTKWWLRTQRLPMYTVAKDLIED